MARQFAYGLGCFIMVISMLGSGAGAQATPGVEKNGDGIVVPVGDGFLTVTVRADDVLRITFAKDKAFAASKKSIITVPANGPVPHFDVASDGGTVTLTTAKLKARVDTSTGAVSFLDSAGKPIISELPGGRTLDPVEIQGEKTFSIRQQWQPDKDESLYGMGENQLNLLNLKGYDLDFWQHNGTVALPMLVSSKGYGILWDNTSYTRLGDLRDFRPIPAQYLFDKTGKAGGLTTGAITEKGTLDNPKQSDIITFVMPTPTPNFAGARSVSDGFLPLANPPASTRWEGEVLAPVSGDYQFQAYFNGGLKVWIDNKLVIDHWRQIWLPWFDVARVPMEANHRYAIKLEWNNEQATQLKFNWKTPTSPEDDAATVKLEAKGTSLWSQVGDGIDYYFCYGPTIDGVIGGYRQVTGQAPMMPLWAFGLWQSRQHYKTQQESLDIIDEFRRRKIPLDIIVQDWQYWPGDSRAYGSHVFDPTRFAHPDDWIKSIHDKNARLLISVWGQYVKASAPYSPNFDEMLSKGFLYDKAPKTYIDMFNADARKLFWSHMDKALFSKGVDSWWLDGSEPEIVSTNVDALRNAMNPTAMGSGSRMLNGYPLMENQAVYEGQRASAPNQRVLLLTRSAFLGQQRYASAVWSGDTTSTWTALQKQIVAGLGFSISGMPYWSMDSGGFAVPGRFSSDTPTPAAKLEWDELQTRWFQFAALTPLERVHGEFPYREMYQNHTDTSPAYVVQRKFNELRYALMPYIYALAGDVTNNAGTMMRPLVMDFQSDTAGHDIKDEYMFGPFILVNPVYKYQARTRTVYLPEPDADPAAPWYELWTGLANTSGQTFEADAPFDTIPIFIRSGAIIPTCPVMQYTTQKPMDPITLHIYTGIDGKLTLYEDDGQTYGYERGESARIPLTWDDAGATLTFGKREGSFPKMLAKRTFNLVFVSMNRPSGLLEDKEPDKTVEYTGEEMAVHR